MPDDTYDILPPPPPQSTATRRDPGVHQTDRPCPKCGYNLRGLPRDHPCPECGHFTNFGKYSSDELQYGNPRWARTLAWGMAMFFTGSIIFLLQFFLLFGLGVPWIAVLLIGLAGSVLEFLGLFWFCKRERIDSAEHPFSFRRCLKISASITFCADVLMRSGLIGIAMLVAFDIPELLVDAIDWLPTIWAMLLVARCILLGLYLHTLARRIPDDTLANQAILVSAGIGLCSPAVLFGIGAGTFVNRPGFYSLICSLLMMAPFLFFYGWGLKLLWGCVRDLAYSAAEAAKPQARRIR